MKWFCWLQHTKGRLAVKCEVVELRVSTFKSEVMILWQKTVDGSLQVGSQWLPQVKEFKYLLVLIMSEGKLEHGIKRRIGAVSAARREESAGRESFQFTT